MNLTKKEREILTLMDDEKVEGFLEWAQDYVDCTATEIKQTADKLLRLGLVEIVELLNRNDLWYFRTKKAAREMLDDEILGKLHAAGRI